MISALASKRAAHRFPARTRSAVVLPALILLCAAGPARAGIVDLPPVINLQCRCTSAARGEPFTIEITWRNPPEVRFEVIEVFLDDQLTDVLFGDAQKHVLVLPAALAGLHVVGVRGRIFERLSPLVPCATECLPPGGGELPRPRIDAPSVIFLSGAGVAETVLDGLASRDAAGGTALRYLWREADGQDGIEILHPRRSITQARFRRPGIFQIELLVFGPPDFSTPAGARSALEVRPAGGGDPAPPVVLDVPGQLLVATADRLFERSLTLAGGSPAPMFHLVQGPRGLEVDPLSGMVRWVPRLQDAGETAAVVIRVENPVGSVLAFLDIAVLDPGLPGGMYGFRRGPAGGGASLGPAPPVLLDGGRYQPPLDLYLGLGGAPECSVQGIVPDPPGEPGGDRHAGLRFAPGCDGGPGGGAGGLEGLGGGYFSGSSATGFFEAVVSDFTVELWLANVPGEQPGAEPGAPAFIFAMAGGTAAEVNWLIGVADGGQYSGTVATAAGPLTISSGADFADGEAHHLVYVRRGESHRLYVDGTLAEEASSAAGLQWDPDYEFFLGNDPLLERAFAGDVLFAGAYPEALSDGLIDYLFTLGPVIPEEDDIPDPIADICPDPREVNRGDVEADGSQSESGIDGGGGGGGDGGGAGGGSCPEFLRPFEWSISPSEPRGDLDLGPTTGEEECYRKVNVGYDWETEGPFDLEISLLVTQVPVRGVVKTGSTMKMIRLPTPDFRRGAVDQGQEVDVSDPVALLFYLFADGPEPGCLKAADANDDGATGLADAVFLLNFLFLGGPEPPPPFAGCGLDPTQDSLGCALGQCP